MKGPCEGILQPDPSPYKGQLYVLINGGSFSNSAIVASCLKRNTQAVFIGEETGGNRQIIGGNPRKLTLPNSGIQVEIPTRLILDSTLPFAREDIPPDFEIKSTYEDIIHHHDPAMDQALKLIHERNSKK